MSDKGYILLLQLVSLVAVEDFCFCLLDRIVYSSHTGGFMNINSLFEFKCRHPDQILVKTLNVCDCFYGNMLSTLSSVLQLILLCCF